MVVEPTPTPAFEVIQPELVLELLVVALDPPAELREPDELRDRRVGRQGGEPARGRLGRAGRPLDEQPLHGARLMTVLIAVSGPHAQPREARAQAPARALSPHNRAPRLRRQLLRER